MCEPEKKNINPNIFFALAILLGVCAGYLQSPIVFQIADTISQVFINLLKLVSLPIIFLSIVSTAAGMENMAQVKRIGRKWLNIHCSLR